ncbi:hypothetical protein ALC60_11194 [Trachymyrmex zeteki]|uniref:DUF8207 domain-containing protein n=1 Tax=Mycetomoellerius zeteki TaxID=64791 RepID=A0A151WPI8_9HYME|nr:hypothetical protein ALC60_11194 [Trachymyrmex zeteki]
MADVREREKIAREIERTSESIRKKHRALKTGRIEESIALDRHFKPIIKPLRQIVDSPGMRAIKRELRYDDAASAPKRERKEKEEEASETFERSETLRKSDDRSHDHVQPITSTPCTTIVPPIESFENVFETTDDSFATKVQHRLQTSEGREALRASLGPLGRKYVEAVMNGARGRGKGIDRVYGVYLHKDGLMFGNKCFYVDDADNIIIDGVRYAGTPGFYELIFKRIPDDLLYTEDDMHKYKSILLATNAHKHKYHSQGRVLANRGYKYKHVIAPLMSITPKKQKKSGKGLPHAMTLNDNAIDYVHWDDPNELVDRLRLLDASHRAGNNAYGNEMLSIIEELREAGLIIN